MAFHHSLDTVAKVLVAALAFCTSHHNCAPYIRAYIHKGLKTDGYQRLHKKYGVYRAP